MCCRSGVEEAEVYLRALPVGLVFYAHAVHKSILQKTGDFAYSVEAGRHGRTARVNRRIADFVFNAVMRAYYCRVSVVVAAHSSTA